MAPPTRDRELREAARGAGFTPKRRDLSALVALLAHAAPGDEGDEAARDLSRALLRLPGDEVVAAAAARIAAEPATEPATTLRLAPLLAAVANAHRAARPAAVATLIARLERDAGATPDRGARAAAIALGKLDGGDRDGGDRDAAADADDDAAAALLRCWARALPIDHRRAVAAALGKVGGPAAADALRAHATDDPELRRIRERALLMLERTHARGDASAIRGDVTLPRPLHLRLHCRAGLAPLLADELVVRRLGQPRAPAPRATAVELEHRGPLAALHAARLWLRLGIALPPVATPRGQDPLVAIATAVTRDDVVELLTALTDGALRYRLAFAGSGHRRHDVWRLAGLIAAARPALRNDPTETTWELVIDDADPARVAIELVPRRLVDPRFAYRVGDVPAASHPTIAAALARVAAPVDADHVWDPFAGSGTELVECARLAPAARLLGSDLDAQALATARRNAVAAGVDARLALHRADALTADPRALAGAAPTLIVSNPPLGRRLRGDVGDLLERFVARAARLLAPGGRLVWVSPVPRRTERAARDAGLVLERHLSVDLGGYDARLERWGLPALGVRVP